jgi:hypothetical protein
MRAATGAGAGPVGHHAAGDHAEGAGQRDTNSAAVVTAASPTRTMDGAGGTERRATTTARSLRDDRRSMGTLGATRVR